MGKKNVRLVIHIQTIEVTLTHPGGSTATMQIPKWPHIPIPSSTDFSCPCSLYFFLIFLCKNTHHAANEHLQDQLKAMSD